jgi:hypothetical protein
VITEAPVRWRRSPPAGDAAGARVAAARSLNVAETERDRQQALAGTERQHVVLPLRKMREENHLSELFMKTLDGKRRRDRGPAPD